MNCDLGPRTHTIEPELLAVSVIPVGQNLARIGTSVVAKTPTYFWVRYVAIDMLRSIFGSRYQTRAGLNNQNRPPEPVLGREVIRRVKPDCKPVLTLKCREPQFLKAA